MKTILGLDLGTNSVGWALVNQDFEKKEGKIIGMGSRIIPMSQDIINDYYAGKSVSQTATRTRYRSSRRLRERHLLRRNRLHRILNIMGFLPEHYKNSIDFEGHPGMILPMNEIKLPYNNEFIFKQSFEEMLQEFKAAQPEFAKTNKKIPHDWTIYYLRQKALKEKISKEELAWIILNFNQKRGYYQLRGEYEEENNKKKIECHSLKIIQVEKTTEKKGGEAWYNLTLENGWIYKRSSKSPLYDWLGKTKEFIVTFEIDEDGTLKKDKEGKDRISFRAPKEEDWTLIKTKTQKLIDDRQMTVGQYIYNELLSNPKQKIKGKLIRTIERKYYKDEISKILNAQSNYHSELQSNLLYKKCIMDLYPSNEAHRKLLETKDIKHLIINDIIFYQRPLKSKKSDISKCRFETRSFMDMNGELIKRGVNCIPKSHPLFQEYRIWQWINNLRIFERERIVNEKLEIDYPVTKEYLNSDDTYVDLFDFLMDKKEINQKSLLKYFKISDKTHRWNYLDEESKSYPCNETRAFIITKLKKAKTFTENHLTPAFEEKLWHIIYSINDKTEYYKAIKKFADTYHLSNSFTEEFSKIPPFEKEYGSYSHKALRKILPLMRLGKYWSAEKIDPKTINRIKKIITGEYDETIKNIVREKAIALEELKDFSGLPVWLATYVIYDRHSEESDIKKWRKPDDISMFLKQEFKQHSLRNPIAEQVISETLKVVRDIWKMYGKSSDNFFDEIHVELGRELKNSAEDRKKITKLQSENENTNLRIKAILLELLNHSEILEVKPNSPSQIEILKIYEEGVNNSLELPTDIEKISKSPNPSRNDIIKYKAWLEQGYRSPYTGEIIPLSKLFTSEYQVEHIIPQARYFDDSFTNKVICESEINKLKDKQLAYEFILNHGGQKVELAWGKYATILKKELYEALVNKYYKNSKTKRKKLLMDDIPDGMIERQLNDTRYISKVIMKLLSNIVREEHESEFRSKKLISCTGAITSRLKHEWGLNEIWNKLIAPRFIRLNGLTNNGNEKEGEFGFFDNKSGKRFFRINVPLEYQKGFQLKRIDHRHHALDALVIACATANHVNYLNNESHVRKGKTRDEKNKLRFDLRNKLRKLEHIQITDKNTGERKTIQIAKEFLQPWNGFPLDALVSLSKIIVSHKKNIRVINKASNYYQKYVKCENGKHKKEFVRQIKGDNWSIRKPLHKETIYGKVFIDQGKTTSLSNAIAKPHLIINNTIRSAILNKISEYNNDQESLIKFYKANPMILNGKTINKINIWTEGTASRVDLNTSCNKKYILEKVTDSGIKKILLNHLRSDVYKNQTDENGKLIPQEMIAFTPEGIEDMNKNIVSLNDGKFHQPIYKLRVWESGNRFQVGQSGNKTRKYAESAKGTNLYFAIYEKEDGTRNFETVSIQDVIEYQKQVSKLQKSERFPIPINNLLGRLLFTISPNDLVYVPNQDEIDNPGMVNFKNLNDTQVNRIYKMISCSEKECYFIQNSVASLIKRYDSKTKIGEFGSLNKMEKAITGEVIKLLCWKLDVDLLGNITTIYR